MHNETVERVLTCEQLPSLPAVAARVIELTSDQDVDLKDLASTIQHDQALAAKVLRTINSSFFGLRNKCTTISQALVMLGLSAVKSLALGFSLVDTLSAKRLDGFDYEAFWRRGIYTGVGAKQIARRLRAGWEDEAFLGGLLQDIGVVALYQALGSDYAETAAGDHRELVARELAAFDVQHPEIGAMLASRWKLPDELVLPIRYHERPTAAPGPLSDKVKAIALANMAHDVLTDEQPVTALAVFEEHASQWFNLKPKAASELLREISAAVGDVADLFQLETGDEADIELILEAAEERLVEASRESKSEMGSLLKGSEDALTGLRSRAAFDDAVDAALEKATGAGESMVIWLFSVDGHERMRLAGDSSSDDAVAATAEVVSRVMDASWFCARYAIDTVGVLAPGIDRTEAERLSGLVREELLQVEFEGEDAPLTVSVGVAAIGPGQGGLFKGASAVEAAAMRALDAARVHGGNCERTFVARQAA